MKVISLINGVPLENLTKEQLEEFREKSLKNALEKIGYKLSSNNVSNT